MATRPPAWKVLLLALAFVGVSLACKLVPWFGLGFLDERSIVRSGVAGLVALAATVVMTALALRWKATRPLAAPQLVLLPRFSKAEIGLATKMALGGGGLFAVTFGTALLLGGIRVSWAGMAPVAVAATVGSMLLTTILNAAWEEYAFRGWALSACVNRFGPHPVALGIGTIFGLVHLLNPNVTWMAIVSVAVAGWLIGYVMLASGNIIAAIGIHLGWNVTQSVLTTDRLWIVERSPSPWLSGGAYGLEASVPGLVITVVAAGVAAAVLVAKKSRTESVGRP
jgi:hypothetical protein